MMLLREQEGWLGAVEAETVGPFGAAGSPRRPIAPVSPAAAIANAVMLLQSHPAAAERQALELLKVLPGDARARLVIGAARRRLGDLAAARSMLSEVAAVKPQSSEAHYELGLALAQAGERDEAIASLRRAAALEGDFAQAWRALSEQLYLAGDAPGATQAYDEHVRVAVKDANLRAAIAALRDGRAEDAEAQLRPYLRAHPGDLGAIRLLAESLGLRHRHEEAELILNHCLRLAPGFTAARFTYALTLYEQNKAEEAIAELEALRKLRPDEPHVLSMLAACHVLRMDHEKAILLLENLVARHPREAKFWISYGQSLRIVGRRDEAIVAYRRALAEDPCAGDAYWSLADLKIGALDEADIAAMTALVENPALPSQARVPFHYSLGRAYEDCGGYEASFAHYAKGARLRRGLLPNDPEQNAAIVESLKRQFTPAFFAEREGWGLADAAPIFVVGMPRSGSTLIEQILGSHSQIEATMELPFVLGISNALNPRGGGAAAYPLSLASLPRARLRELGQQYLDACASYRRRGAPYFIDKMPANLFHLGLIKLMLPNAKVIDIRREPMGCCFSVFKQYFFRGQNYSYDLGELGRYYRDYVSLMAHYESVLPGFIHRLHYDELIDDAPGQTHRLLDFVGVDRQDACLEFWRNDRPISTHSSEQVRRPIYRDGLDLWRRYDPWLGALREGLGEALESWSRRGLSREK